MAGEINFGILNPALPGQVANSFYTGQQEAAQNALLQAQLQHAQGANELAKYQLSSAKRADEVNARMLEDLKAAGNDQEAIRNALIRAGKPQDALKLETDRANLEKTKADSALKRAQALGGALVAAHADPSDATISRALDTLDAIGADTTTVRAAFAKVQDPEQRRQMIRSYAFGTPEGLKALEAIQVKPEKVDSGGTIGFVNVNPLAGPVGTKAGPAIRKTMTPAEAAAFNNPTLQHIETADGVFAFNPKTGKAAPVVGNNGVPLQGSKGLTEVQAKGVGFATRAAQASKIIENIGENGNIQPGVIKRTLESTPLIGEGLGTLANVTQSADQQQVEQAQRDFVNSILRQESGAAISESEFQNAKKQYFPQPGDSKQVIQQKAQNRAEAVRALETQAGPGMRQVAKPEGPQIGDKVDGYVYLGGDPSNKKSWKVAK